MYLVLVKVTVGDPPETQRRHIESDVLIMAGRLVGEFGMSADDVGRLFTDAIDEAYEAEREAAT